MDDFKVNQTRPACPLVINDVRRGRVAVRPRAAKLIAPELMSAPEFVRGGFQHPPRQRTAIHMLPNAFSRQFVGTNRVCARSKGAITIAVQHLETADFPPPPVLHLAPKTDRYARHAEIQIGQLGQLFAVDITALDHDSPAPANLLRDRIDLERVNERRSSAG